MRPTSSEKPNYPDHKPSNPEVWPFFARTAGILCASMPFGPLIGRGLGLLHSVHGLSGATIEGLDAIDVLLGAEEDGAALVDLARLQVQHGSTAGDRAAATIFHQECHRIALRSISLGVNSRT